MKQYQKLMCVKGLIMSLDEQIYRVDTVRKDVQSDAVYDKIISRYYDAIKEQLSECKCGMKITQGEDTDEKAS